MMRFDRHDYQTRPYIFKIILSVDDHCASNARFRLDVWTLFSEPVGTSRTSHESRAIKRLPKRLPRFHITL